MTDLESMDSDMVQPRDIIDHVMSVTGWHETEACRLLQPIAHHLIYMPAAERMDILEELASEWI